MPRPHFDPNQLHRRPEAPPLPQTTPPLGTIRPRSRLNHAHFRPLKPRLFRPLPSFHTDTNSAPLMPRPPPTTLYNSPAPTQLPPFEFAPSGPAPLQAPPLPAPPTAESRCCEAAPLQGWSPFAPDAVARRVRHPLKMGQWDPRVGRANQWDTLVGGASWGLTQWELRVGGATWGVTQWGLCVGGAKCCQPMGSMMGGREGGNQSDQCGSGAKQRRHPMRLTESKATQWDHQVAGQSGKPPNGIHEWAGQGGTSPNHLLRGAEQPAAPNRIQAAGKVRGGFVPPSSDAGSQ